MKFTKLLISTVVAQSLVQNPSAYCMEAFRNGFQIGVQSRTQLTANLRANPQKLRQDIFVENAKFQFKTHQTLHPLAVIEIANEVARKRAEGIRDQVDFLQNMNTLDAALKERKQIANGNATYNPLESTESKAIRDSIGAFSSVLNSEHTGGLWKSGLVAGLQNYLNLSSQAYDRIIGPKDQQKAQIAEYVDFKAFEDRSSKVLSEMKNLAIADRDYANALRTYLAGYQISLDARAEDLLDATKNPEFAQAAGIQEIRNLLQNQQFTLNADTAIELTTALKAQFEDIVRVEMRDAISQFATRETPPVGKKLAEADRLAFAAATESLARDAHRLEGIKAAASILKNLVDPGTVRTIRTLEGIASSSVQISSAINKFTKNLKDSNLSSGFDRVLSGAILSGDLLSVELNLAGMFFGSGPDPVMAQLQEINQGIDQIKEMIVGLSEMIEGVSKQLNEKLDYIIKYQEVRFNHIDTQLTQVLKNQGTIVRSLNQLMQEAQNQNRQLHQLREQLLILKSQNDQQRIENSSSLNTLLKGQQEIADLITEKDLRKCLIARRLFAGVPISRRDFMDCYHAIDIWMASRVGADSIDGIQSMTDDTLWGTLSGASEERKQEIAIVKALQFLGKDRLAISRPARWGRGASLISDLFLKNLDLIPTMDQSALIDHNERQGIFDRLGSQIEEFYQFQRVLKDRNYLGELFGRYKASLEELRTAMQASLTADLNKAAQTEAHDLTVLKARAFEALINPYYEPNNEDNPVRFCETHWEACISKMTLNAESCHYLLKSTECQSIDRYQHEVIKILTDKGHDGVFDNILDHLSLYKELINQTLKFLYPRSFNSKAWMSQLLEGPAQIPSRQDAFSILFDIPAKFRENRKEYSFLPLRVLIANRSEFEYNSSFYPVRAIEKGLEQSQMTDPNYLELEPTLEMAIDKIYYLQNIISNLKPFTNVRDLDPVPQNTQTNRSWMGNLKSWLTRK